MDSQKSAPGQDVLLEWNALEYEYHPKTSEWYVAIALIALSLAVAAFVFDGFFFAALIVVAGFVILLYGAKPPAMMHCRIFPRGIQVDSRLYPFTTLLSFGIDEMGAPKLIVQSKKTFSPYIIVPLGDTPVEHVRDSLIPYLKEEEHHEPFAQKLMERLGF